LPLTPKNVGKEHPATASLSQHVNGAAKYSILVDLVTQHVKAQQHLVDYMKQNGMLEHVPQPIQDELNSVAEFAKMMQTQNGKKTEEKPKEEGESNDRE
jgi:hypothetical protein